MGKIVCLMGKSSTGKDTIYKELLREREVELKKVVSYTTRPIREGERDGVQYHFTNEEGYDKLFLEGKVIESREYHTFHGIWRYFTVDDGQIDLENANYIIIGTLEALAKLREHFGEDNILPVMIELDDGVRLQRALDRERKPENHRYEEMCRRFLADSEDFSEEKMREAKITKTFYNGNLKECLKEITDYLKKNL